MSLSSMLVTRPYDNYLARDTDTLNIKIVLPSLIAVLRYAKKCSSTVASKK